MELKTYLAILRRRKWIVAISVVVITIVAIIATVLATPIYVTSTTLRVATIGSGVADPGRLDIGYTERLINTYATIITSGSMRAEIKQRFNLDESPKVSVEMIPDTELIMIRVEERDPEMARSVANALAEILVAQSRELYSGSGQSTQVILSKQLVQIEEELLQARGEYERLLRETPEDSASITAANQSIALKERTYATLLEQYEEARVVEAIRANAVSVIEPAYVPRTPAKPRHELNIALGILVGLISGVGLALVFENLDTTLYTEEQIEAVTQLAAISSIPAADNQLQIARIDNGHYPQLEAFRRLRINIFADAESLPQAIMITSAERGEGKSTISANLAVTIAQSGRKVVIVDCDMRLPKLHKFLDLPNKRGLTSILTESVTLTEAMQDSSFSRLQVITSGPPPPNPTELLGSPQMGILIEQLKQDFDIVLFDTPALLSVSDAAALVPFVDSVILVVARARSRREAVRMVRRQLVNVKAKSIAVVVNQADQGDSYAYQYNSIPELDRD